MTRQESAAVLALMSANWSHVELSPETVELWHGYLAGVQPEDGRAAAQSVILHSTFFPAIANFRSAVWDAVRTRQGHRALPSGSETPVSREVGKQRVAELKAMLKGTIKRIEETA